MAAHKAVAALATDIMQTSVFPAQGRVRALSAKPPPEIDDRLAVQGHGDGGADLAAGAEIPGKRIGNRDKTPVATAVHRHAVR